MHTIAIPQMLCILLYFPRYGVYYCNYPDVVYTTVITQMWCALKQKDSRLTHVPVADTISATTITQYCETVL